MTEAETQRLNKLVALYKKAHAVLWYDRIEEKTYQNSELAQRIESIRSVSYFINSAFRLLCTGEINKTRLQHTGTILYCYWKETRDPIKKRILNTLITRLDAVI